MTGIERRLLDLTDRLAEGASSKGFEILSPMQTGVRSGILSLYHPEIAKPRTVETLKEMGIHIGWREGALRVSPHYYKAEDEIDALISALMAQ